MILEVPRLYIRNINDEVITTLDRGDYFDDTLTRFLAGKASVLEFTILKREGDYELFSAGKKISFKYEDEEFWLNMMIIDQDEKELTVTALSLNLEMNNETTGPYTGKSLSFERYFNDMVNYENSVVIGLNEVSEKRISNEWTGTDTNLSRLFSLATVFGAELEFVSELNPNGSLKRIVMNVYKEHSDTVQGVGTDRRSETFRFGKDIKTVRKTEDSSGVYTAIRPYGKDGLSIASIEKEIFDENGKLLFATYKEPRLGFMDHGKIYAPQSRDVFPSTVNENTDKWTVKETDEMEYSTAEALFGYALGELKKNCVPKTEWEIEGYIKGRIGDTIRVADNGYKPEIYLDARITEQTISFTKPSQNKSTFSNVKELQSQVSTDLLKEMEKIIEANKVYSCTVSSTNGVTFKNGEGSTVLTAIVRDSAVEVTDKFSIEWFKDGVFLDTGAEITVNASDVDGKSVYKFVAKKADETVAGMYEVTVTDVSDGKDGESGRGISGTPETVYGQSKLEATMPDTWSTTRPDVPAGEYLWTKTITKYTDNTESSVIIPTLMGPKGDNGLPTYVHPAWANSPDGTVDFTTVYPNENLIVHKDEIKDKILMTSGSMGNMENGSVMNDYISVTPGEILSFNLGNQSPNKAENCFRWNWYDKDKTYISRKAEPTRYLFQWTVPDGAYWILVSYPTNEKTKIEKGNKPTLYTPSPTDDPVGAYMKYMGTCSNHSETAPTDPSAYEWARILGAPGGQGEQGKPGADAQQVVSGYLSNEALVLPANASGVVSDFSKATGKFVVYEGQTQKTSGVTYAVTSQVGITTTIDASGTYKVTALSADLGTAIFKATYSGVSIEKILIATKAKQGHNGATGSTGPQGPPTGITESATVPTSPYVGMLWKHTGSVSGYIKNATYRWDGSKWSLYIFTAENISASTLSAICANLGTVTAGTINGVNINGSVIKNTFKNWETGIEFGSAGSGLYLGGTTTLKGGRLEIQSNLCDENGVPVSPERRFFTTAGEEGFEYRINDSGGTLQYIQVNGSGLAVSDMSTEPARSAILTVDDIIKLKNFNEKTKVIFDAGYDYNKMSYPRENQKYTLGDITKIKWIIINWAMYNPSTGASQNAHEQTILEYSSSSAAGSYRIVLPYDEKDGNSAAVMTIKRIRFPFENGTTYLQGDTINAGTFSKWWLMRKVIIVEG